MCSTGRQNLCDLGRRLFTGARLDDPISCRMCYWGSPVVRAHGISALGEHTVVDARSGPEVSGRGASRSTPPCSRCSRSGFQGTLFGGCNPRWDIPNLLAQ